MSREGVAAFLTRIMDDEAFRDELKASPDATLAQFDLTPTEVAAIKSADPSKIQELGVDERVSKLLTPDRMALDAAALASSAAEGNPWWITVAHLLRTTFHP